MKQHGHRFVQAMTDHSPSEDKWIVIEVSTMQQIKDAIHYWQPDVTIMNYHHAVLPKLEPEKNFGSRTKLIALPHDDLTLEGAKVFLQQHTCFEAVLWQDPTLKENVPGIYKIPRLVNRFVRTRERDRRGIPDDHVFIKVFGFGFGDKQPELMLKFIEEAFDKATIEGHFPKNEIADPHGHNGEAMIGRLFKAITKPNIKLLVSPSMSKNHYMTDNELAEWLSDADINLCLHGDGTGIASTTDCMMAAGIPFAINDSPFFRHLPNEIKLGQGNSMKDILQKGIEPWKKLAQETWSPKSFAMGVNEVLEKIRNGN